ncbi:hypothetical protein [Brevibacterium sp.]|uniref:hypothetical protein n=1 Tax=Brevibacterium sp. TaxID=1701 RepID=UPI002811994C|nr:hypothetical protein [Brevibacterium sp.]
MQTVLTAVVVSVLVFTVADMTRRSLRRRRFSRLRKEIEEVDLDQIRADIKVRRPRPNVDDVMKEQK